MTCSLWAEFAKREFLVSKVYHTTQRYGLKSCPNRMLARLNSYREQSTVTKDDSDSSCSNTLWLHLAERLSEHCEKLLLESNIREKNSRVFREKLLATLPFSSLLRQRKLLKEDLRAASTLRKEEVGLNKESEKVLEIEENQILLKLRENEQRIVQSCLEMIERQQEPYLDRIQETLIEIRAAAGGEESALFARDLWSMYEKLCARKQWNFEVLEISKTEQNGYREIVVLVKAKGAYNVLRKEAGVHRVQRIPRTESSGRIHSSTISVAILPGELLTLDGSSEDSPKSLVDESELKFEYFRAGGAGGQHVNKTESAVRVRHIPSGITATCQEERSQFANKKRAVRVLAARISAREREKKRLELSSQRKEQTQGGERNERIRTYNYLQSRVTDHRSGFSVHGAGFENLLNGGESLEQMIDSVREQARQDMIRRICNMPTPIEHLLNCFVQK
ncbi:hypothetical protein GpartN1_g1649.t1 [Galdieria partita]|uniref:Prokaryotic-type class I peptide chain release factors domain-containing protein n=1 Tax=Galdieria partita TaxID=83374 RepID=A0A9C7PSE5_9RHOD|nr:hypothetical protein GpartN1_g1649.t1 [Galdieria partita]